MKGRCPGADAHADAVLSDVFEGNQAGVAQESQHLGHQVVQGLPMLDSEIAEGVVVHRHAATQPDIGEMLHAPLILLSRVEGLRALVTP